MKKILLTLFVGFIGIISFCNAGSVVGLIDSSELPSTSLNTSNFSVIYDFGAEYNNPKTLCISLYTQSTLQVCLVGDSGPNCNNPYVVWSDWDGKYFCFVKGNGDRYLKGKLDSAGTVYGSYFYLDTLLNEELPELSSFECQEKYSLIPISEVNQNYCEINGLCPACPEGTGFLFSSFYVKNGEGNWNELSGTENYFVYIPDYLGFNYDYSNNGRDLDFTVGVGVDTGSVQSVIDINSYRPTSEDFTNVFVSCLTLVMPYIFIALFIIFVRKLLKRIFK